MTKNEAINILEERYIYNSTGEDDDFAIGVNTALDMAIEALSDRPTPCEKCIHVKSCRKVIILKNRTYKLIKYCSQGAERREP